MRLKFKILGCQALAIAGLTLAMPAVATTWSRVLSEHFVVYSDVGPKMAQKYATRLEQYRYLLGLMYNSEEDAVAERRLDVYFLDKRDELAVVWPGVDKDVAGFVQQCTGGMTAYAVYEGEDLESSRLDRQSPQVTQTVIFHEYAHQFMFLHTHGVYPTWYVEGFAEFYGTTLIQGDQAVVGRAWPERVIELHSMGGSFDYAAILRDDPKTVYKIEHFHAESWLLYHWIMADNGRMAKFQDYLDARDSGEDPVKAFERIFGLSAAELGETLSRYLNGSDIRESRLTLSSMPQVQVSVSTLPAAADRLALLDSAATTCSEDPKLLSHITTEAAKYPGDDYAQGVKARADIMLGDESLALDYYKAYTAAHPDDAKGYYWLGLTQYLMARHGKIIPGETADSQIAKARQAFIASYRLDPNDPVNLYYLSLTGVKGPDYPDDMTLNAAIQAHLLSPAVTDYAFNAALLLLRKGRLEETRAVLTPLASNPHGDAETKAAVAAIIDAIDKGTSAGDIMSLIEKLSAPAPEPATPPAPPKAH